jgi:hypothetical protein
MAHGLWQMLNRSLADSRFQILASSLQPPGDLGVVFRSYTRVRVAGGYDDWLAGGAADGVDGRFEIVAESEPTVIFGSSISKRRGQRHALSPVTGLHCFLDCFLHTVAILRA